MAIHESLVTSWSSRKRMPTAICACAWLWRTDLKQQARTFQSALGTSSPFARRASRSILTACYLDHGVPSVLFGEFLVAGSKSYVVELLSAAVDCAAKLLSGGANWVSCSEDKWVNDIGRIVENVLCCGRRAICCSICLRTDGCRRQCLVPRQEWQQSWTAAV